MFANQLMKKQQNLIVLIGQRARFANQNIGWIELGEKVGAIRGTNIFNFKRLIYRPTLEDAERFFHSGRFAWNPGYFVTTPRFLLSLYERFAPEIFETLMRIKEHVGKPTFAKVLSTSYSHLPKISFDNAILEKLDPRDVLVIAADLGWSDVGAWEALKEALEVSSTENVTRGKVLIEGSSDNLIFNYTDQLTVGIDLNKMIVINTDDVLLVCNKESVPKIKKLVESLLGTENEYLT